MSFINLKVASNDEISCWRDLCKSVVRQYIELYLLNYKLSSVAELNYSPAEILRNLKLKTKLLVNKKHLLPRIPVKLYEDIKENR